MTNPTPSVALAAIDALILPEVAGPGYSPANLRAMFAEALAVFSNGPASSAKVVAAPTAPASTSVYAMQGLAGSIIPTNSGKVLVTVCGTINAAGATTVDIGLSYQLSYGTGTAPANADALTGTQVGSVQTYTSAVSPTAVGDVNVPFSLSYLITGLTVGTAYWLDLAAESITTASDMGLVAVSVVAIEQ